MTITIPMNVVSLLLGVAVFFAGFIFGLICVAYIDKDDYAPEGWK